MPKHRKPPRKPAPTVRVAATESTISPDSLQRMGTLLVVQGAQVDLGRHMLCNHPIVIGRDEEADFALSDGSISRAHCCVRIAESGDHYRVVDLGSTNGTTLNGTIIGESLRIKTGDKIFLGSSVLRFSYSDSVDIEYYSQVEELVHTDSLTGLDTQKQYESIFEVVARQAVSDSSPLSVAVIDMDGLKGINDQYGHQLGSFAITETAKLIRAVMQDHGHLARFGGDEFVACFPTLGHQDTISLADELHKEMAAHDFTREGVTIHPTLSIGVSTYPDHGGPEQLFKAADDALYRAKRGGKNRTEGARAEK